ncbi:hypothetical protein AAC387_Pa10g1834 [Persea americana]
MAELQKENQEKRKMELNGTCNGSGGTGIYGLLVLGGALAAAAFMAAISNQGKRRPNNSPVGDLIENPPSDEEDCSKTEAQGLLSIIDTRPESVENHQCIEEDASRICSKMIQSHGSVTSESLESAARINGEDEGTVSRNDNNKLDNLKADFSAAADYDINDGIPVQLELFSFSGVNNGLIDKQSIKVVGDEKEGFVNSSLAETLAAFEDSAEIIKEAKIKVVLEEYPSMQPEEEDDNENYEEESIEEKEVEECSDGTGDSSMESNTEAIWPVDLMEELIEKKTKALAEISAKDKPLELEEIGSDVKIGYNGKEVAGTRQEEENANYEITRKTILTEKEKKRGCVIMQRNRMNSDSRAMWVWALLGSVLLLLGHLICASFSSHAI